MRNMSRSFAPFSAGYHHVLLTHAPATLSVSAVVSSSTFGFEMTQWSANMDNMGTAPYRLLVQDNGRAVLYDSRGTSIWHTN
jgi:hypothetical protein